MTFDEAERTYAELQEAVTGRRMTSQELSAALARLLVQDPQGAWWRIDPLGGHWLRWDGATWRPSARPASPSPPREGTPRGSRDLRPARIVVETIDASGRPARFLAHATQDVAWILAHCEGEDGSPDAAGDASIRFSGQFDRAWATLADQGFQRGQRCAAIRLVHPPPPGPTPPHLVVTVSSGPESRCSVVVSLVLEPPGREGGGLAPSPPAEPPLPTPKGPPIPAAWHLVIQTGPDVGLAIPLGRVTRIGRCPDNDLCPDYPDVSRYHAVVQKGDDACVVQDLGSTHGTKVNGVPVEGSLPLADGDLVELSSFRFYIRRSPAATTSASTHGVSTSTLPKLEAAPGNGDDGLSKAVPGSAEPPGDEGTLPCPTCLESNPAGVMFCLHCGGRFPSTRPAASCPSCGRSSRPGARFCTGCGRPMR